MDESAVCYVASRGYLFETVASAIQMRKAVDSSVRVFVLLVQHGPGVEGEAFERVCRLHDVELLTLDQRVLGRLDARFGRLFIDAALPPEVSHILYLDGDTQVVGGVQLLLDAISESDEVIAVRDPMVLISEVHRRLGRRIERQWDAGEFSARERRSYINSGMLGIGRRELRHLRERVLADQQRGGRAPFGDQDRINRALGEQVRLVSMAWNFPGFFLGTELERAVRPHVVHFMSSPRPWNAVLAPWGPRYHRPYEDLASAHPHLLPYWNRFSSWQRGRYRLQQGAKSLTERRRWDSPLASQVLAELEADTDQLR